MPAPVWLHGADQTLTLAGSAMNVVKVTPSGEVGDDEVTNSLSKRARELAPTIYSNDLDIEAVYEGGNAPTFQLGTIITCVHTVDNAGSAVTLFNGNVLVKSMKPEVMVDGAVKYTGTLKSTGKWTGLFAPTFPT